MIYNKSDRIFQGILALGDDNDDTARRHRPDGAPVRGRRPAPRPAADHPGHGRGGRRDLPGRQADLPAAGHRAADARGGFTAMLLNPAVAKVQQRIPRRGLAVTIVTLWAALVFIGLAAAFGVPLVNGITHLADRLPGFIASAQQGNGWIGHLVTRYHIQSWVQRNAPELVGYAQSLTKPALTVGKG